MTNEIEIKFKIEESDNIRNRLLELGGSPQTPYNQTTYGFFSYDSIEKGIFPRIRDEHGKIVLTVKVRPKKETDYFERKEYSMEISNIDDGVGVMKSMGYGEVRIFEKNREEWKFDKVEVVLDKLYFGTYIEIEGSKEEIEKMVKKLDFRKKEKIAKAYLGLEDDYLKGINK